MNQTEYDQLTAVQEIVPTVMAVEFYAGGDRTLLYGYDVERVTWHVYLLGGEIHKATWWYDDKEISKKSSLTWRLADLVPNKRAYPERTDHRFAVLAAQRGVPICFTTFTPDVPVQQFYGRTR